MRKKIIFLFIVTLSLIVSGCGEDEGSATNESNTTAQGWHFQGRDCLACHNVDLQDSEHLLVGGTLYKSASVSNQDDLNNVCGGDFVINFLDGGGNIIQSSKDYEDVNSKGYKGKGNLFILRRKLVQFSQSTYHIQIADKNGVILANSGYTHNFTTADYDINNPADPANRVSCNSCHIKGGYTAPLYVQQNPLVCK